MAKQSEAKAKVSLDSSSFEKGAKAVVDAANGMRDAVTAAFAATGVALLAVFGAEGISSIVNSAHGVITLGEEMANAGKKAGLAAGQFYLFHNAIEKGLSLKTVAGLIGENAEVLNQSASTFRDVSIKLWAVGEKIRGFWLGLMDRVAPVLSRLLDGALGVSLVKAGQDFGNALVDAGKVIYQMLADGDLWKNVVTVAAASFAYLGNIVSGLIGIGMSEAFQQGFEAFSDYAKTSLEWFGDNFGKLFLSVIIRIESAFMEMWIRVLGKVAKEFSVIPGMGKIIDKATDIAVQGQEGTNKYAQDKLNITAPDFGRKGSVADQLKELFSKTKFEIPSIDGKPAQQIGDIFKKYLDKFNESGNFLDTPGKKYENNSRQKTFGADSLAVIGGGGNVYVGLGILDYSRLQYQQLREMNAKLGKLTSSSPAELQLFNSGVDSDSISRAQVSNVA